MNLRLLKFLAVILLLQTTYSCQGQSLPSISEDNIKTHIKTLASDEFLGRRPGTLGEEKTVEYLAGKLKEIGIEPANGDSYFQEFTISRLKYETPSKMVIFKNNGETSEYDFTKDFYSKTSLKANEKVSLKDAEIVFAGFGIIAPEYNWDDYKHIDVKDKVVLVLFSDPGFYTKDESMFNGMSVSQHGGYDLKKKLAMERGAKAVFMIHHEFIDWDQIGQSPNSGYSAAFVKDHIETVSEGLLCSGIISIPVMKDLLSASGHGDDYTEQALSKDFKGLNLKAKMSLTNSSVSEDVVTTRNVLGILKGKKRPDEHIIYTSHWDHVGTRPARFGKDSIFNGAIDNASGTAMHLEVARAYKTMRKKPERSIVFFFTSAEEMGLLGAEYYANNPLYPLNKAVCVINADGHFATNKMKTATSVLKGYSEMDTYVDNAVAKIDRNTVEDTSPAYMNIFQRSDHYPFVKKGVPAVWAMGNQNPVEGGEAEAQKIADYMQHYHQVTDEYYEGFNAQNITADATMNFLIGLELANSKDWPNWNEGSEYKKIRDKSMQN
ncbi:M20/M25/M40 family metallo-hydrolase [Winogradskyella sp. 3972H.M.0a.05]|uniref:M20/M25/M40 family metallo-hydrolase n=1 Tax=Winogradskyella sp. 3972H.M.0a.05 TaxID=2950277 RepID=UPI003399C3F4